MSCSDQPARTHSSKPNTAYAYFYQTKDITKHHSCN